MAQLSVEEIGKYSHSPAHYAVARRDYAGLQRIISALPRLAKAGEVRTELDSMAEERRADALAAVLDRRDVPGRETPLHLAVRLADASAAEMLMSAGADWSLQNEHGWSALQEAICSHQDVIAMVIMKHYQPAAWAKWCRRLPRVVATMRNMRDFYMELTFHFESSVIPFVGRIAPSDTYRIWKRGSNLRADMTLAGFDGFRIQRSDQSFLFLGDGSEDGKIQPGSLCMLGHKSKEVMNALEGAGTQPTEAEIAQEVAAMSRTNMYRPGIDVTQADLAPQLTWRRQEKTEMVGAWKAKIYDMHNVMVSVKSRRVPGAMTDEELFGAAEIDGDFDVENEHDDGDYADLLTEEERHQLEAALKQEHVEIDEGCFTDERKSTRITTTTPARMSVDNAHHALRSKEKELRKSSVASSDHIVNLSKEEKKSGGWFGWGRKSFRHDNLKKADERDSELPAAVATEADRESTAFPTRKKNHLKKDPFINNFTPARASFSVDDYSHSIDADITKPHRKSFKQETTRKMAPPRSSLCVENKVSDLLGENEKAALKYERGRRSVDARPDIKIDRSLIARKEKENKWRAEREAAAHRRKTSAATPSSEGSAESEYKKGLRPVLWLTPDFPLKTEELLPLLDILANKVKAVRRLRELLTTKLPTGTFPVKVAIPVVPTIRVVVTFTKFEELKPLEEFTTPPTSPTNDKASSQRHLGSWFSWIKGVAGMSASMDEHPENVTDPFRIPKDYTWTSMEAKRQRMKEKKSKGKKMKKTAAENSASETRV